MVIIKEVDYQNKITLLDFCKPYRKFCEEGCCQDPPKPVKCCLGFGGCDPWETCNDTSWNEENQIYRAGNYRCFFGDNKIEICPCQTELKKKIY